MEIDNREIDFVKWNKTHFFLPADDVTPCRNKAQWVGIVTKIPQRFADFRVKL